MKPWLLCCIVLAAGCDSGDYSVNTLGQRTPLGDRTALETLCDIQAEFRQIPSPALREVVHHPESSRRMQVDFAMHREVLPAYYQFVLTPDAEAFVAGHTQAEITAAVAPLVLDPEVGGEAAVIIASLASNRRFRTDRYGYHNSKIAEEASHFLHDTGYRSPAEPGDWSTARALEFPIPSEVWASFRFPDSDTAAPTLNGVLNRIQFDVRYYENGFVPRYEAGYFNEAPTLDEFWKINELPPIPAADDHAELIARYGQAMTILGSYSGALPNGIAVYELGVTRYWPLIYSQARVVGELRGRQAKSGEYFVAHQHAVREGVYRYSQRVCGG